MRVILPVATRHTGIKRNVHELKDAAAEKHWLIKDPVREDQIRQEVLAHVPDQDKERVRSQCAFALGKENHPVVGIL